LKTRISKGVFATGITQREAQVRIRILRMAVAGFTSPEIVEAVRLEYGKVKLWKDTTL